MVLLVFSVFALANTTVSHATSSDEVTEASGTNRFVVWQDNTPGNYEIFFRRSVDDGATWQATKNLSNNPGPSANPEIAVYGSNVYVVWLQQNADNTLNDIFFRRSTDNGATWKPFVKLTSIGNVGGSTPQVINSGSIYVVWDQQNGEIYFRRSTDNGATWKPIFNLSSNPGDSRDEQIGVSGSNAYVVWKQVSDDGTRSDLFFRRSTDNGATWKAKVNLSHSQSGQFTSSPQMAVSGSNVHVVWSQFDSFGSIQVFARSSADNGAVWKSADSLASYSGQASNTRVRVGAAGSNVYVLHAQVEGEDPKAPAIFDIVIVASRDNGNTWEAGFTVATASAFVIDPDPQILALGSKVYVIWRFGTDGDVGLAFRRSIDNGVTWGPESGDLSNGPRITKVQIDATGSSIFVVWGKPFFSEVFLLRSANSGSTWQSVKNLSNNSGFSASLQIGL